MYKLVVFDLDGTLADTLADLAAAVNHALSLRGLPVHPTEAYRYFVGNGADNLMVKALGDSFTPELAKQLKEDFSAYYAEHSLDATTDYPGISDLLGRLSADGIMTAVISNKPDAFVPRIMSALYKDHSFTRLSGQRSGIPCKPDPTSLVMLMDDLGVSAADTLYVGDSDVDVAFGHGAGVKVCGVSWGFRGIEELRASRADMIADTAAQLQDVIYESD